jgi:6-phosphogluconolactonase (cycloisomerase 2 family)
MKDFSISLQRSAFALMAFSLFLALTCSGALALDDDDNDGSTQGRVYVLTNNANGNTVVVFHRAADGSLTRLQEVATGGLGSGPGELPANFGKGPGPNPLDSGDGLAMTSDGRYLMAVNSRSNDISVFAVGHQGLRLVSRTPTGGNFPVSIAHHSDLVYVLNEGESPDEFFGGVPNMTGFRIDRAGGLHSIPNSTRVTGSPDSAPSQIAFSPDGDMLIVTEMSTSLIGVYRMGSDGRTGNLVKFPANNPTPLAVAFGHHGLVAITEGNDTGHRIGSPNGASLSTYRITDDDTLQPISRAVTVNKTGTCWVRFSVDGRFAFTGDTGSGTVSTFSVSRSGEVTLLFAADTGGVASVPIDLDVTPDGKFLYVLASFQGAVKGFHIEHDGSLTPIGSAGGMPITIQGIVAR